MVELTDATLNESHGNYNVTCELMQDDGVDEWMLRSNAIVTGRGLSFGYILHFWHDGQVYIKETQHPPVMEVPDFDIRELHEWVVRNGWKSLVVDNRLTDDPRGFDFWLRMYRSGLVESEMLRSHENEEIRRLTEATIKERELEGEEDAD